MSEANADDADNEMKQHLSEKLGEEFVSRQLSTQQSVVSSKEDGADTIEDIAVKLLDSGNQKNGENVEIKSRYI